MANHRRQRADRQPFLARFKVFLLAFNPDPPLP